jgi:hypothetical protein
MQLLLTDDQTQKVTDIYNQRFADLKTIRDQMLPQLKSQYDQLRDQIKHVLTPPQFELWDTRFQAVRNHMIPTRGGPGGPGDFGPGRGPPFGGGPDDRPPPPG